MPNPGSHEESAAEQKYLREILILIPARTHTPLVFRSVCTAFTQTYRKLEIKLLLWLPEHSSPQSTRCLQQPGRLKWIG